jgi:hypothetical protein
MRVERKREDVLSHPDGILLYFLFSAFCFLFSDFCFLLSAFLLSCFLLPAFCPD